MAEAATPRAARQEPQKKKKKGRRRVREHSPPAPTHPFLAQYPAAGNGALARLLEGAGPGLGAVASPGFLAAEARLGQARTGPGEEGEAPVGPGKTAAIPTPLPETPPGREAVPALHAGEEMPPGREALPELRAGEGTVPGREGRPGLRAAEPTVEKPVALPPEPEAEDEAGSGSETSAETGTEAGAEIGTEVGGETGGGLTVGPTDDAFEREAEKVAEAAVAGEKSPEGNQSATGTGSGEAGGAPEEESPSGEGGGDDRSPLEGIPLSERGIPSGSIIQTLPDPAASAASSGPAPAPAASSDPAPAAASGGGGETAAASTPSAPSSDAASGASTSGDSAPGGTASSEAGAAATGSASSVAGSAAGSTASTPAGGGEAPPAAQEAVANKGPGAPVDPGMRSDLEGATGAGLGSMRVHDDPKAKEANEALGSRAFAQGSDVFLGEGESPKDTALMAHEAAHVAQQGGGGEGGPVRRQTKKDEKKEEEKKEVYEGPEGKVDKEASKIFLQSLKVPTFKKEFLPSKFILPQKTDEPRADDQRQIWESKARAASLEGALDAKIKAEKAPRVSKGGTPVFFLQIKGVENYLIGTRANILSQVLRPYWNAQGKRIFYDVDHKRELQLAGANTIQNMWLLKREVNQASGRNIKAERDKTIQRLLSKAGPHLKGGAPSVETARRNYTIWVRNVVPGLAPAAAEATWTIEQIQAGEQLGGLKVLSKKEIEAKGLAGSPDKLVIFTNESGGGVRQVPWGEGVTSKSVSFPIGTNFQATQVTYDVQSKSGTITGTAFAKKKSKTNLLPTALLPFDLKEHQGVDYGGFISSTSVTRAARSALREANLLSPLAIDEVTLEEGAGLVIRGVITASVPPIQGATIDFGIDGDNAWLSKTFSAGEISIPGPVNVTDSFLTISLGTKTGLVFDGQANFEVPKLGKGYLKGMAGVGAGVALEGMFTLDLDLLDPAEFKVWFKENKFGASANLGIQEGKVKGIKSARLTLTVDGEKWSADGTVEPDVPGVEKATLKAAYDPEKGFEIAGDLTVGAIPGLKSGTLEARLSQKAGGGFALAAGGTLELAIPGLESASVEASYDDGGFNASASIAYKKGPLDGSVNLGVTNQPVVEGKPGGEPGKKLTVYGGGTVSVLFGPGLKGTVGLQVKQDGSMEVSGAIAFPDSIELFPEKKLDKNIFTVGLDIPIIGFSVAGQRVGIFFNISGGLTAKAGIGPGQLRNLKLAATFNPERPEDATVTGGAELFIPASAGLRLFIRGALGAGIPIVSASAGLEVGAELGVDGAVQAGVNVDWSPKKGLELKAQAEIFAEPKFRFDLTGFLLVEADLLLKRINLYEKRWKLAAFELGSGLRFGIKFPFEWKEGEEFNPSLSDVEFEVPDIDTSALMKQLIGRIV